MDLKLVSGSITISNGQVRVEHMNCEEKPITDPSAQLVTLGGIVQDALFNFEKENQKQFIPTKATEYKLPPDCAQMAFPSEYIKPK